MIKYNNVWLMANIAVYALIFCGKSQANEKSNADSFSVWCNCQWDNNWLYYLEKLDITEADWARDMKHWDVEM